MAYEFLSLIKANDGKHKYIAKLQNKTTGREKNVKFGQAGANDFTIYSKENKALAEQKKKAYIARHSKAGENWNDVSSKGFWSKNLLWSKPSITASLTEIKKKYF
jgi:hypothetical protein